MAFDGSGNYTPAAAPSFPAVAGAVISPVYYNAVINDIATALGNCLTRDGQGKPSAAIDWNGKNLTGVGNLAAATAAFTGNVTVPTQSAGDNSTKVASTAYVDAAVVSLGGVSASSTTTFTNKTFNLTSNTLSGTMAQFNIACSDGDFAYLASPSFTGTVVAPIINYVTGTVLQFNGVTTVEILSTRLKITGDVWSTTGLLTSSTAGNFGYIPSLTVGGTVTQTSSRTNGVTLNKSCGQISLFPAVGTTSWQAFTVTNSAVTTAKAPYVWQKSGADAYEIHVTNVVSGSFQISYRTTGGTTSEAPVFGFILFSAPIN